MDSVWFRTDRVLDEAEELKPAVEGCGGADRWREVTDHVAIAGAFKVENEPHGPLLRR